VLVVMFTLFLLGQCVANSFSQSPIAVRALPSPLPSAEESRRVCGAAVH
jgi:hypothetical protein